MATKTGFDRQVERATQRFISKRRSRSMSQAARRIKRDMQESVRLEIDAATPVEFTNDIHPSVAAMVAGDAVQESRHSDAISAIAQIPPVQIGLVAYRVIAEAIINGQRKVALICRTRSSTLAQHGKCGCIICDYVKAHCATGAIDSFRRWDEVEVWHHDKTKTYHLRRIKDGAFLELPRNIKFVAYEWYVHTKHLHPVFATTADGRAL